MARHLFTSESVTEGHPDKVCDQISDAVLDAIFEKDPNGRVACETCASTGLIHIMGEITTSCYVDIPKIARQVVLDIGYNSSECGFDGNTCAVITNISIAHKMAKRLTDVRKQGLVDYLRPDGKTQITVEYDENGKPVRVDTVVLSTQHSPDVTLEQIRKDMIELVIKPTVPAGLLDGETKIYVNPTGRFVSGGPAADTGLTGRKIIVDTYGGSAPHGGGAFSGKDPTKVDRSAAYAARWVAKNVVAAGLADKCQVQLAYAIGVARPVSVLVETFGTGVVADSELEAAVEKVFDLRPTAIIRDLDLRKPIYRQLAAYGHMGREDLGVSWEKTDRVEALKAALGK